MDLETDFEALGFPLPPLVVVAVASEELIARISNLNCNWNLQRRVIAL